MTAPSLQHDPPAICPRTGEDAADCLCLDHMPDIYVPPHCGVDSPGCRVVVLGEDDAGREWCEAHRVMVD